MRAPQPGLLILLLALGCAAAALPAAAAVPASLGDAGAAVAKLSNKEVDGGLREALAVGVERAVKGLGRKGGYLDDPSVRIPLPHKLKKAEKTLRMLGKGDLVDEFVSTANDAAERAVPLAAPIIGDAIRAMSIEDARRILTGPDDSATRFFEEKTAESLQRALLPVVRKATDAAGVTRSYKRLLDKAGSAADLIGGNLDVDAYVTEKALDGLFLKVAEQEKQIRSNPVARSSDLLKKVFGAAAK